MSILATIRKGSEPPVWGTPPGRGSLNWNWQPGSQYDYQTEAGDLYLNGIVLSALNFKSAAISDAKLIVEEWDAKEQEWVKAKPSPQVDLYLHAILEPNDDCDWSGLFSGVLLSDEVDGNAYLIKRYNNGGNVMGYRWEPHNLIRPVSDDPRTLISSYEYLIPGGTPLPLKREQVVHFKQSIPDPKDRRKGLSPLAGALRSICSDNEIENWIAPMLRNGASPGLIISPKAATAGQPIPPQNVLDAFTTYIKQFIKDKRGEPMATQIPVDVTPFTWSPTDLKLVELQQGPVARLCSAMGIDQMVICLPSANKTYSNYGEAIDAAGKQRIIPTLNRWARQMSQQTIPDFFGPPGRMQYRLAWDFSDVFWLADETIAQNEMVRANWMADLIDRWTALTQLGQKPAESDKGLFYSEVKAAQFSDPLDATPAKNEK